MAKNKWSGLVDKSEEVFESEGGLVVQDSETFTTTEQVAEPEQLEVFATTGYLSIADKQPAVTEYSVCDLTSQEIKLLKTLEGSPRSYSFEFLDGLSNLVKLQLAVEVDGEFMRGSRWVETVRSLRGTLTTGCPSCN